MKIWNVTLKTVEGDFEEEKYCGIAENFDDAVKEAKKLAHIANHDALNALVENNEISAKEMCEAVDKTAFYASEITMISKVDFGL